jgi:hypothetical protein
MTAYALNPFDIANALQKECPPIGKLTGMSCQTVQNNIIVTLPNTYFGNNRCVLLCVVFDTFSATAAFTASVGSNTGTQNDFATAAAITPSANGNYIFPTGALAVYPLANPGGTGTQLCVNVTVGTAGAQTCNVTLFGTIGQ